MNHPQFASSLPIVLANATIHRPERELFTPKPNLRGAACMRSGHVVAGSQGKLAAGALSSELLADEDTATKRSSHGGRSHIATTLK
jgi:hypothetical protein